MRSFGEILRSQRRKLGLTQRQVADSVGVSDAYICSLESDKRCPPPYHTVVTIADTLQLDVERLWEVAARYREKHALEKSRRRAVSRRGGRGEDSSSSRRETVPDSQINAFFERPEIQMATFGFFQKQPKDMSMEEKRAIFYAISEAQKFISGQMGRSTDPQR